MSKHADQLIDFFAHQLASLSGDLSRFGIYPVVSKDQIRESEHKLGFRVPTLLKRIYLEIGNGGRWLGPGYGLIGLPNGYDNDAGWNLVTTSHEIGQDLDWWGNYLVLCDWGCSQLSVVDCADVDQPVYRWDGNYFQSSDLDEPNDDLWDIEADSLIDWFSKPNISFR